MSKKIMFIVFGIIIIFGFISSISVPLNLTPGSSYEYTSGYYVGYYGAKILLLALGVYLIMKGIRMKPKKVTEEVSNSAKDF